MGSEKQSLSVFSEFSELSSKIWRDHLKSTQCSNCDIPYLSETKDEKAAFSSLSGCRLVGIALAISAKLIWI